MRPALLPFILAPALMLASCGKDSDTQVVRGENGEKVIIETSRDDGNTSIEATNEKGERVVMNTTAAGATWPADAPPYATAYPGATLTSSMSSDADGSAGSVLIFETTDAPAKVIAHYKALATKAGLTEAGSITSGANMMFGAGDDASGREFMVQASPTEGKTQGSITYTTKAKG
jgi:hypothetical protein